VYCESKQKNISRGAPAQNIMRLGGDKYDICPRAPETLAPPLIVPLELIGDVTDDSHAVVANSGSESVAEPEPGHRETWGSTCGVDRDGERSADDTRSYVREL
jgi:hypothetical protein